ncbi:MAG: VWA domain-containing protein [Candidatus Thermoplasmatota archaeon]|nr:VWA domain-containing protein [Candidatus Thermoplasmatota archaeon]
MTYDQEISRDRPGLFVFLIDQSRSMSHKIGGGVRSKAEEAADAVNNNLNEIVNRCTKSDGVRNYFDVGIIGYGAKRDTAISLLKDATILPISDLESRILTVEKRKQQIEGEEIEYDFPIWFNPVAASDTPMVKAISMAKDWISQWIDSHKESFPPIVINITDGEATDGDPVEAMNDLRSLSTEDGYVLTWNCHLSGATVTPVLFPNSETSLPEEKYAKQMFQMSSQLPEAMLAIAREEYKDIERGARGYVFNAQLEDLIKLLDIGTRAVSSLMR